MKKKIQKITALSAVLLTAVLLCGCRIGNTEFVFGEKLIKSRTVFWINDQKCSIRQAKLYLCNYKNLYGKAYGLDLWEYDFDGEDLRQYVKDVTIFELSKIVCMDLLAEQQNIRLSEKEEELASSAAEEYYDSLSDSEKEFMEVQKSDVREAYENYALAKKLYDTLTQGINEEVSDDEARVIRIQQIYVTNQAIADSVSSKLAAGEDFAAVAAAYNEAGEIELTIPRGYFPKEVEDIAFNLNNDTYSGRIDTENGFYFIKCLNKFEQELTEANKDNILVRREKEQFEDVYQEFVETAEFEMNEELWNETELEPLASVTTDSFFALYDKYFSGVKQ